MIIKKFIGGDIEEIQARIIEELGPFSVILFTRIINTGFLKKLIFGNQYEVVVGIEADDYDRHVKEGIVIPQKEKQKLQTLAFTISGKKEVKIAVSGPVKIVPQKKNFVFLAGADALKKTLIASKFAFKWSKENLRVELIFLGTFDADVLRQMHSLVSIFNLSYQMASDEKKLRELIDNSTYDMTIIILDGSCDMSVFNSLNEKTLMLVLDTNDKISEQIEKINKYRPFNLFGLIYAKYEEKPSFLFLEELFEKQQIPISYLLEGGEIKLANVDDLDTRIINERLTHLPSW